MIFQPVLHPALLLVFLIPLVVIASIGLGRSAAPAERWRWVGRIGMAILLATILLRPGLPGGSAETLSANTDVLLVVDTTASSIAEDWGSDHQPRLDAVKKDIRAIMDRYPGARFGLITFDREAEMRVPITADTTALSSAVEGLTPEVTQNSRGSSIGVAATLLKDALELIRNSTEARGRLVFYFGDGEQTVDSTPESFADSAKLTDGGRVLGYGTQQGGKMRQTTGTVDGGEAPYIEYQGQPALAVIDQDNLRTIAQQLGVKYELREPGKPLDLPEPPATTSGTASTGGHVGTAIELYPYAAGLLVALLSVEMANALAQLIRLRRGALTAGKER
ncbi:vWA domain-containing protein [Mycetocola saprophilus]|uniref:vWA domain-containing protein n=1 Tax=Mycetocola saprophilus TaxID=76636 RepID=UPI0004C038BC|nr:VWA domain-containing protein [Mycetocola saprophilus]